MFKEIKERHEEDKQLFERLGFFIKINPNSPGGTSFIQANQDRAELIQLVEEAKSHIKGLCFGRPMDSDVANFLKKLE